MTNAASVSAIGATTPGDAANCTTGGFCVKAVRTRVDHPAAPSLLNVTSPTAHTPRTRAAGAMATISGGYATAMSRWTSP